MTLLIICIVVYQYIVNKNETFDAKFLRTPEVQCGIGCTLIDSCAGYAVTDNSECYLSKKPILGEPDGSLFQSEYKPTYKRCNKLYLMNDQVIATLKDMKDNAVYTCTDREPSANIPSPVSYDMKYINNSYKINSLQDLDNIYVPVYETHQIIWPPTNLTNKVSNTDVIKTIYDYDDIKPFVAPEEPIEYTMKEMDDEYLGTDMYLHECVSNINQKDCLKACLNAHECVGTEWNTLYTKNNCNNINFNNDDNDNNTTSQIYHNVCCPRKQIKSIIKRRLSHQNGKFYLKQELIGKSPSISIAF